MLGKLIASIMVKETEFANERAIAALDVQPTDHVLDIGCGSGRSLQLLLEKATSGHVSGVDPSTLMANRAANMIKTASKLHKADMKVAAVEHLPYPDASFDKVMSVHTAYFWPRLDIGLGEIARVMKPRATLALVLRTDANPAAVASFPSEIYTFRPLDTVIAALRSAGFAMCNLEAETEDGEPALIVARRC